MILELVRVWQVDTGKAGAAVSWLYCNTTTGRCYFTKFISISKYLVPTICQVSFDVLGKHSQHSKNENTRTTSKQKYQQIKNLEKRL